MKYETYDLDQNKQNLLKWPKIHNIKEIHKNNILG